MLLEQLLSFFSLFDLDVIDVMSSEIDSNNIQAIEFMVLSSKNQNIKNTDMLRNPLPKILNDVDS